MGDPRGKSRFACGSGNHHPEGMYATNSESGAAHAGKKEGHGKNAVRLREHSAESGMITCPSIVKGRSVKSTWLW